MARTQATVFVRVTSLYPVTGEYIPVPNVRVECKDSGFFWDTTLSVGEIRTGADGRAAVPVAYDAARERKLDVFFELSLADADRSVPASVPANLQMRLPGSWTTRHDATRRVPNLTAYPDADHALPLVYGLAGRLRVSYSDYHASGRRNPVALPEDTVRIHLADYDTFLGIDWLNPDDTLTGLGYDPRRPAIVPAGDDGYPYADTAPTAPTALDGVPAGPHAWIDPPGAPVGSLGGGSFTAVGPLATDSHGYVFMIDGNLVLRFYPDGTLCEQIGLPGSSVQLCHPAGIALDEYRILYVADTGADRVLAICPDFSDGTLTGYGGPYTASPYTTKSTQMAVLASAGSGPGDVRGPCGVAVIPERGVDLPAMLAVADTCNHRVTLLRLQVSGQTGFSLRATSWVLCVTASGIGALPAPATGTHRPVALAAARDRTLYVSDSSAHRICRYKIGAAGAATALGDLGRAGGVAGVGPGEFDTPGAVALDCTEGWLYVADTGNHRVQRLAAADGSFVADATPAADGGSPAPVGLAVDDRGELYVADSSPPRVTRASSFAADGAKQPAGAAPRPVGTWTPRSDAAHLHRPGYLALGKGGTLWVADTCNNRVLRYTQDPAVGYVPAAGPLPTGLSGPVGVAEDADGGVFVVDAGNHRVRRYDQALTLVGDLQPAGADALSRPRGLVVAARAEPTLYLADAGNDRVAVLHRDGTVVSKLHDCGCSKPLSGPEDVAVDAKGQLYVADTGNARIAVFDAADAFVREITLDETFAPKGAPTAPTLVSFVSPCGISVDPAGNLLVTDRGTDTIYRLSPDGKLLAFWDLANLANVSAATNHQAGADGRLRYGPTLGTTPISSRLSKHARRVDALGTLTVTPASGTPSVLTAAVGWVVLVPDGAEVSSGDTIAVEPLLRVCDRDLARLLVLDAPARAVLTDSGLLAIADTGHDRIRLVRTASRLDVNLFDLGEALPDISLRATTHADWRDTFGLKVNVGDVDLFDDSHEFASDPVDDFSGDEYVGEQILGPDSETDSATNALRVLRQAQRWFRSLSRLAADSAERWGDEHRTLDVDLFMDSKGEVSFTMLDVHLGRNSPEGRTGDAWDDSVVAHEFTHWVYYRMMMPRIPYTLLDALELGGAHKASDVSDEDQAISEGFAEYVELFWGAEGGSIDRVRGFGLAQASLRTVDNDGKQHWLVGGASTGAPTFADGGLGLRVEGAFANGMYQVHRALADPDVVFADAPSYWWRWNTTAAEAIARRFGDLVWHPLRMWPAEPSIEEFDHPAGIYLANVLRQARAAGDDAADVAVCLLELNNLLLPVLDVTLDGTDSASGSTITGPLELTESQTRRLTVRITDATGRPLRGLNVTVTATDPANVAFSAGGPGPRRRRGRVLPGPALNRATNASGIATVIYTGPVVGVGHPDIVETITIGYQADFDDDAVLAPPDAGADLATTLRQTYLYQLRGAAKAWPGTGDNLGPLLSRTLTFRVKGG